MRQPGCSCTSGLVDCTAICCSDRPSVHPVTQVAFRGVELKRCCDGRRGVEPRVTGQRTGFRLPTAAEVAARRAEKRPTTDLFAEHQAQRRRQGDGSAVGECVAPLSLRNSFRRSSRRSLRCRICRHCHRSSNHRYPPRPHANSLCSRPFRHPACLPSALLPRRSHPADIRRTAS
jgi:hypothetical protein